MTAELIEALPEADYHADKARLSASGAKRILKAPALYRHWLTTPEQGGNLDIGTAAHALILGEGMEAVYVAPFDNWQTKAAQTERDVARADGLSPVLPKQWEAVCDMADTLSQHTQAMELLADGRAEVTMYARDRATSIERRGRLDWLRDDGVIVDYKTTVSAAPWAFAGSCAKYGYHLSEANYRYLCARNGIEVKAAALIAQEKEPPYLVEVFELDEDAVALGYRRMEEACRVLEQCQMTGEWPGYTRRPFNTVSLPGWAFRDSDPDMTPDPIWEESA